MLILAASCRHGKSIAKIESTKDSINVIERVTVRDSLIFTKVDSAGIKALVRCPDGKPADIAPIKVKSKNAVVTFEIKNGVAKADCLCDSVGIISRTTRINRETYKQHLKDVKTVSVIPEPCIPMPFKILSGVGVLAIGFSIYKLTKFFK